MLGPEGTPLPGIGVPGVPPYRHKHPPRALLRGVPVWIFIPSALGLLLVQPERDLGAPSLRGPLLSTKVSVRRAAAPLQGHPRVLGVGAEPSLVGEEVVGSDRGGVRLVSLLVLCKTSKNLALRGGWQLLPLPPGRRSEVGQGEPRGLLWVLAGSLWESLGQERKKIRLCVQHNVGPESLGDPPGTLLPPPNPTGHPGEPFSPQPPRIRGSSKPSAPPLPGQRLGLDTVRAQQSLTPFFLCFFFFYIFF